jgi:hypothetical protein
MPASYKTHLLQITVWKAGIEAAWPKLMLEQRAGRGFIVLLMLHTLGTEIPLGMCGVSFPTPDSAHWFGLQVSRAFRRTGLSHYVLSELVDLVQVRTALNAPSIRRHVARHVPAVSHGGLSP